MNEHNTIYLARGQLLPKLQEEWDYFRVLYIRRAHAHTFTDIKYMHI